MRIMAVPAHFTVGEMLELVKSRRERPDLAYVWIGGSLLCLSDPLEDFNEPGVTFGLTATKKPPNWDALLQYLDSPLAQANHPCCALISGPIGPRMKHGKPRDRIEPRTILVQQNRETGAWNSDAIFRLVTQCLGHLPDIPAAERLRELTEETVTSIRATVLAIALLRADSGSRPAVFRAQERLGLEYLRKVSKSTDWELEIERLVSVMKS